MERLFVGITIVLALCSVIRGSDEDNEWLGNYKSPEFLKGLSTAQQRKYKEILENPSSTKEEVKEQFDQWVNTLPNDKKQLVASLKQRKGKAEEQLKKERKDAVNSLFDFFDDIRDILAQQDITFAEERSQICKLFTDLSAKDREIAEVIDANFQPHVYEKGQGSYCERNYGVPSGI